MTGHAGDTFFFDQTPIDLRFERLWRLTGTRALTRLADTHVVVIGLGGVGSFAAEALARSGLGRITLVDYDKVCVTNTNRQLHALSTTVGRPKADLMAERLSAINPRAHITPVVKRCDPSTVEAILSLHGDRPDWVADCIDQVAAKVHLIATCYRAGIRLVTSLGAAARLDPTRVRVADLARTHTDPLGKMVRKKLRTVHGLRWQGELGIPAVFSDEHPASPWVPENLRTRDMMVHLGRAPEPSGQKQVLGSAVFVTAVFGMALAGVIVRQVVGEGT